MVYGRCLVVVVGGGRESRVEVVIYERQMCVGQPDLGGPVGDAGVAAPRAVSRVFSVGIPVASHDACVERILHRTVQYVFYQMLAVTGDGSSSIGCFHVLS